WCSTMQAPKNSAILCDLGLSCKWQTMEFSGSAWMTANFVQRICTVAPNSGLEPAGVSLVKRHFFFWLSRLLVLLCVVCCLWLLVVFVVACFVCFVCFVVVVLIC